MAVWLPAGPGLDVDVPAAALFEVHAQGHRHLHHLAKLSTSTQPSREPRDKNCQRAAPGALSGARTRAARPPGVYNFKPLARAESSSACAARTLLTLHTVSYPTDPRWGGASEIPRSFSLLSRGLVLPAHSALTSTLPMHICLHYVCIF